MNIDQVRKKNLEKKNKLRINIIGVGKVASTMAVLWQHSNHIEIQAVWNRSISASKNLQYHLPNIEISNDPIDMPKADIIVIGVSDQVISSLAEKINQLNWITPNTLLLHFSGALGSDILASPKNDILAGSMHPVFAFSHIDTAIKTLPGHLCAIEGDKTALPVLKKLAQWAGLESFVIHKDQKARYHAALSISANFLVTLNDYACTLLKSLSIPAGLADKLVNQLMQQNLNQLQQFSATEALTGPIKRGDINTVSRHWQALTDQERTLYQALTLQTLRLTTLSIEEQVEIRKAVSDIVVRKSDYSNKK
ncbi:MAG: DUF2520 domain-containing protein [Snodgrassella sp.]|nr:DUF2520 domain-containing protein [Snodgrassella sp.]